MKKELKQRSATCGKASQKRCSSQMTPRGNVPAALISLLVRNTWRQVMIRQLEEAQAYLTVNQNGCAKSIFPFEALLRRHGPVKVYWTLKCLFKEKRARLQAL